MKILISSGRVAPFFTKRRKLIEQLLDSGHEVFLGGYQDECKEECERFGTKFVYISMSRTDQNPLADLAVIYRYYKAIRKEKFDVVHSYTAKPNIYGSIAAGLAGVKKIYPTVNGLGYAFADKNNIKARITRGLSTILYKIAFSFSTKVFFQNADDAEEMIKRKLVQRNKCVVVAGSGIDLAEYPFSQIENEGSFIMATRLLRSKGVLTYCNAARIVKKLHPKAWVKLAGGFDKNPDSITREEIEPYVEDGSIEYLGHLDDMVVALKNSSVFVLPSFYREGVPHAVLEAMSIGRAIITTNMPGCKETVNGKNGFLIDPKDVDELADKMIWMIEHPHEVKQMGMESRLLAEKKFDVQIVNGIMCQILEN